MATIAIGMARAGAEPIYTRPMLALSGTMATAMSSFYLLLSAAPVHAAALNGDLAAGLSTGTLMAATIIGELLAPRMIACLGRRKALVIALLLLAIPSFAALSANFEVALSSCVARGFGLGVLLVAACGLAAALAPAARRAEAMGIYGVASAVPAIACVPLGPLVLVQFGSSSTAATAALLGLVGIGGLVLLPASACERGSGNGAARTHHMPALHDAAWPSIALAIGAIATGVTVTFLPLAHRELGSASIMLALLIQGLTAAIARWAVGHSIDRKGPRRALVIGVGQAIAGLLCLALPGQIPVMAGMALSGIGFGILQSASLAAMLRQSSPAQLDGASAVWNAAYDAGLGVGGLGFGILAATMSIVAAFLVAAVALLLLAFLTLRLFPPSEAPC